MTCMQGLAATFYLFYGGGAVYDMMPYRREVSDCAAVLRIYILVTPIVYRSGAYDIMVTYIATGAYDI